jgi:hypothetical protein
MKNYFRILTMLLVCYLIPEAEEKRARPTLSSKAWPGRRKRCPICVVRSR